MPGHTLEATDTNTVWRSKSQFAVGVGFGLFVALVGISQLGRPTSGGTGLAIFLLALAAVEIAVFSRAALVTSDEGIRIRNPLSTVVLPWDQIARFRIGRHGMLSAVCIIDLADGSSRYAFGIQEARLTTARCKEQQIITQLNELAASHRTSPPRQPTP